MEKLELIWGLEMRAQNEFWSVGVNGKEFSYICSNFDPLTYKQVNFGFLVQNWNIPSSDSDLKSEKTTQEQKISTYSVFISKITLSNE